MTYERFEDLPVWQKAADLYEQTEELLETDTFKATRGFRDQLDRAALSVSNNIAEGFERGTTNELLAFIYIARGSAGEVRSMLTVKLRRIRDGNLKSRMSDLISLAESCSRQFARLGGFTPELGQQRPAAPEPEDSRAGGAIQEGQIVAEGSAAQTPARPPAPTRRRTARANLKSEISNLKSNAAWTSNKTLFIS